MVSLKQELSLLDYFGPLVVFVSFFVIVFLISFTCIMWFCISSADEAVVLQKWNVPCTRKRKFSSRRRYSVEAAAVANR
uniref:ATP synthase F0 subunit 8 n=1 Tax=Romanomermis culicivorax TaxID=13658 RepID=A0A915HVV5_ROMCU